MKTRFLLSAIFVAYAVGAASFSFYLAAIVHPFWATDIWGLALAKGFLVYVGLVSAVLFSIFSVRVIRTKTEKMPSDKGPKLRVVA